MAVLTINIPTEVEAQVKEGMKATALGLPSAAEAAQYPDVDWSDIERAIVRWINRQVRVAMREKAEAEIRQSIALAPNIIAVEDPQERTLPAEQPVQPPTPK